MPDVNAIYQSEFLRAEQLGGQVRHATVEAATVEVLGQGEQAQQKIVLKLVKVKQRLPLNKTNAQTLASVWGPMTDNWIGRQLDLRSEKVMFAGKMVDSIRVAAVAEVRKAPPAAAPAAAPPAAPLAAVPAAAPAPVPAAPLGDAAEPDEWPEELADDIPWSAT